MIKIRYNSLEDLYREAIKKNLLWRIETGNRVTFFKVLDKEYHYFLNLNLDQK